MPVNILIALLFFYIFYSANVHAQSTPKITFCESCTANFQYSQAALNSANLVPGEMQQIYVVNASDKLTRVYQAQIILDDSHFGDHSFSLDMTEVNGDPSLLNDISKVAEFTVALSTQLNNGIDSDTLILPSGLNSALDLIGSSDSSAGLNRNALVNSLNEKLNRSAIDRGLTSVSSLTDGALIKFISDSPLLKNKIVTVNFPDGTKVKLRLTKISQEVGGTLDTVVDFDFEIDLDSIRAEQIMAFPQSAGQFSNFSVNALNPDLMQALEELAFRFGIQVGGYEDNPQLCDARLTCTTNRVCTATLTC